MIEKSFLVIYFPEDHIAELDLLYFQKDLKILDRQKNPGDIFARG